MERNYSYLDPLLFEHCEISELVKSSSGASVWIEPPGTERRLSRYAPDFIDDPGATGLFPGLGTAPYSFPPNFIAAASDAALVGYRTIIAGEHFFADCSFGSNTPQFLDKLASVDPFPNEDTRLRRQKKSDTFRLEMASRNVRHIKGSAVALTSTEPSNYGSFLFRVLPKVFAIKQHNLLHLPVIVYANQRQFIELMVLAGVKEDMIIRHDPNQINYIDRVIVPSLRNPDAFLDKASRELFSGIVEKFGSQTIPGRKLYISRLSHAKNGGTTRVMLNEAALIERLTKIGIEIFEPEGHSSEVQVKAFSSAEMIIGPSGSAMYNTVFCRPGTKVIDIESEPDWIYAHTGLFASSELRYGIFVGETNPEDKRPVHRSWTTNIDALIERIEHF